MTYRRSEFELGPGRKSLGDVIKLDPDVVGAFPNADAVNEALRFLIRVTKEIRTISDPAIATHSGGRRLPLIGSKLASVPSSQMQADRFHL